MANGYRDSQFKVTPGIWSGNGGVSGELVNPPFNYTPSTVRVVSSPSNNTGTTPDQIDRLTGSSAIKLQRGFMRNLSTKLGDIGTKTAPQAFKLKFQFNPSTIQQNVEARQDMYLSVLQDPYQLTQPVAASTAFSFELLFDRTHEVMNGGVVANLLDAPGQTTSDTRSGEAADIGVLADLSVMYAIIGQGFTSGTVQQQYNVIKANAEREYKRSVAAGDPLFTITKQIEIDNGIKTIYEEKSTFEDYFKTFLRQTKFMESTGAANNVNIGNSAFLVPMPVRIIFSSLYMIDGYVMSTSVIFTKFNTNMVPIQCRVLLNVNAVYIGFARDKTFLSESITQTGNQAREDLLNSQKLFNDFCKGYGKNLSTYIVTLGEKPSSVAPNIYSSSADNNGKPYAVNFTTTDKQLWDTNDLLPPGGLLGTDRAPYVTSGIYNAGATSANQDSISSSPAPKGSIPEYYDDGNLVQISHKSTVTVYGPYATQQEANRAKPTPSKKVGEFTQSKTVGAKDQWASFDSIKNKDTGFMSVAKTNTATNANGPGKFDTEAGFAQYASGYFLFVADVSMTVATPDGLVSQTKTASAKSVFRGTDQVNGKQWKLTIPPCTQVGTSQKPNPYRDSFPGGNQ